MRFRIWALAPLLVFSLIQLQAQPIRCYTEEAYARDPGPESKAEFEAWLQNRMAERKRKGDSRRGVITLPVIVHIVHNGEVVGEGMNISQMQVQSQIDVLNEDFRRLANTPGFNTHPDGADVEIEFCLAEVDEQGNLLAEPGIHRVHRQDHGFTEPPYSEPYVDGVIKPATIWDPYNYLNIWVCLLSDNILGFARYPVSSTLPGINGLGTSNFNDGVVISHNVFGREGNNLRYPYDKGRSTTHEIGHWLGLRHIWGDGGCSEDDYCEDTPSSDGPHYDCPSSAVSCGTPDMFDNYLDYTDDACMRIFTKCQKERMLTVMEYSPRRKELLQATVCTPKAEPPVSAFTVDVEGGCPGLVAHFSDLSTNRPERWEWIFPGGDPNISSERNPLVTYKQQGLFGATLITHNDFGSDTLFLPDLILIKPQQEPSTFFFEDFERGTNGWTIDNPDGKESWQLTTQAAGSLNGRQVIHVPCFDYRDEGERDGLISPILDFSGKSDISLRFYHAYRRYDSDSHDSLLVLLSTDGGATYPHRLLARSENGLGSFATNSSLPARFIPQRDEDWCYAGTLGTSCFSIDLDDFSGQKNVRIRFEVYNGFGNNIYLDNVAISGSCAGDLKPGEIAFELFPNPTDGDFYISLYVVKGGALTLQVLDLMGRRVHNETFAVGSGVVTHDLRLNNLSSGTYLVLLQTPDGKGLKKLVSWRP